MVHRKWSHKTVEERLLVGRTAVENAKSDPVILAALTRYGYDAVRLDEGLGLVNGAEALHNTQKREYGEQFEATAAVKEAYETANREYGITLKLARVAFRTDVKAQQALALNGMRKRSIAGWLDQAVQFYTNLLADDALVAELSRFAYDAPRLEAEQTLVRQVAEAHAAQARETGEAQAATKARDAALDALDEWMYTFYEVAKAALEEDVQLLEKIGLVVPS